MAVDGGRFYIQPEIFFLRQRHKSIHQFWFEHFSALLPRFLADVLDLAQDFVFCVDEDRDSVRKMDDMASSGTGIPASCDSLPLFQKV